MKRFFDTSVLVAAVLEEHQHHELSFLALSASSPRSSFCAAHSLAELFAALTRYPGKQRLIADQAVLAVDSVANRCTVLTLDTREYLSAIRRYAAHGVIGGTIYDGLIAACALKAKAHVIYTWNVGHFMLLGDDVAGKVRTP